MSVWVDRNYKLDILKNAWDIKKLYADLVIHSLEEHKIPQDPTQG